MGTRQRRFRALLGLALILLVAVVGVDSMVPVRYTAIVRQEAHQRRLEPALVAAVIRVESSYRPTVTSSRGAVGLMQLMPATARWVQKESGNGFSPSLNLTDPRQNIALGAWYLSYLLGRYHHNLILALAAYNSGPSVTDGWLRQGRLRWNVQSGVDIPYPETRSFVARVLWYQRVYHVVYGITW